MRAIDRNTGEEAPAYWCMDACDVLRGFVSASRVRSKEGDAMCLWCRHLTGVWGRDHNGGCLVERAEKVLEEITFPREGA
jgi:hypothetical protein